MLGALPHAQVLERMACWDAGAAPYLPMDDFYFSPLKVLEYMAAGLCTVASSLGELPELLGEGERGILVAPGDAADLARVLVRLAGDRLRAARCGAAARAHVVANRQWGVNAERVLEALGAVARA
jgi:glycosyltransferase involved in cell wall biosynthesis